MVCKSQVALVAGLVLICIGWAAVHLCASYLAGFVFFAAGGVFLIIGILTFFIPDIGKILGRSS
jgi:hypothetical protein